MPSIFPFSVDMTIETPGSGTMTMLLLLPPNIGELFRTTQVAQSMMPSSTGAWVHTHLSKTCITFVREEIAEYSRFHGAHPDFYHLKCRGGDVVGPSPDQGEFFKNEGCPDHESRLESRRNG